MASLKTHEEREPTVTKSFNFDQQHQHVSNGTIDKFRPVVPRQLGSARPAAAVRPRLGQYLTIDDAVSILKSAKDIIVLTGAGISTSLGIPDFRSSKGLYEILKASNDYDDPQELFHIENFYNDPAKFYRHVRPIIPDVAGQKEEKHAQKHTSPMNARFSPTHAFLAVLQAKDKLLTNYTQNIDGLELVAGVNSDKLIQCHGTWSTATCISCGKKSTARKYLPVVYGDGVPFCKCSSLPALRKPSKILKAKKRKRKRHEYEDTDSSDGAGNLGQPGLLKPDITFFGEEISQSYRPRLKSDKSKVDALLIIGTSLKVAPVNEMLTSVPNHVPQIWISKDRCQREGVKVDIELLGECDVIIQELCRRAGWMKSLEKRLWTNDSPVKTEARDDHLPLRQVQTKSDVSTIDKTALKPSITSKPDPLQIKYNGLQTGETNSTTTPSSDKALQAKSSQKINSTNLSSKSTNSTNEPQNTLPNINNKITIELEEGTDNRWFVRCAK